MLHHLRVARPVTNLELTQTMYCQGLGLRVLGSFKEHAGFAGVMLGRADMNYHFEFTICETHAVRPTPTAEDLIVFYITATNEWQAACDSLLAAGFKPVTSFNPFWEAHGRTFEDPDGYRIVLHKGGWRNVEM